MEMSVSEFHLIEMFGIVPKTNYWKLIFGDITSDLETQLV